MSCYICDKAYSRLFRHLKSQHKIKDVCIEPRNIKEYTLMLSTIPMPKDIDKHKKEIEAFIHDDTDLPKDFYCNIEKYFQSYKAIKGIKPFLNVAKPKRMVTNKKLKGKSKIDKTKQTLEADGSSAK